MRRSLLRRFDVYLAVDWSAHSTPSAVRATHDALCVGETLAPGLHDTTVTSETYWRTRHACVEQLRSRLVHHAALWRRAFVGFDFYAETWSGLVATQLDLTMPIRDQAQVRALVNWLARLDAAGKLATLFNFPPGLSEATRKACLQEKAGYWVRDTPG